MCVCAHVHKRTHLHLCAVRVCAAARNFSFSPLVRHHYRRELSRPEALQRLIHKSRWRYAIANRHGCVSAGTRVARARAIARVLQCVAECCSMLQLVTECCSEIADAMGHGSVLQCVAVCCSELQRVAACCNVLQFVLIVLQCVAACCSVLQRDAACCSVLQCVAVCCSVLP